MKAEKYVYNNYWNMGFIVRQCWCVLAN